MKDCGEKREPKGKGLCFVGKNEYTILRRIFIFLMSYATYPILKVYSSDFCLNAS